MFVFEVNILTLRDSIRVITIHENYTRNSQTIAV